MFSETMLACDDDEDQWLQLTRAQVEPQDMSQAPIIDGYFETEPYARALQALRDVRHLLPPEAVAIVDAVLDRAV